MSEYMISLPLPFYGLTARDTSPYEKEGTSPKPAAGAQSLSSYSDEIDKARPTDASSAANSREGKIPDKPRPAKIDSETLSLS